MILVAISTSYSRLFLFSAEKYALQLTRFEASATFCQIRKAGCADARKYVFKQVQFGPLLKGTGERVAAALREAAAPRSGDESEATGA